MDVILFALMLVSLAAAAGFGIITWRLLREDHRRSAARVAALSSAIDGDVIQADFADQADLKVRLYEQNLDTGVGEQPDLGEQADLKVCLYDRNVDRNVDRNSDTGVRAVESSVGADFSRPTTVPVSAMFTTAPGASLQGRPLVKAAVVGVMAVIVGVAAMMSGGGRAAAPASSVHGAAPLELMSMRHAREGATLTVTGLVRNPPAGAEARRVTAVVFAFDKAGGFVASGRAPLDFAVLEPDDESPFVVTVPNVAGVARYRVSFRTEAGVVRHIDRRAGRIQLAGNQ